MSKRMKRKEARTLKAGEFVRLTCSGSGHVFLGEDGPEVERRYEPGAVARVSEVKDYGGSQGLSVRVEVILGPGLGVSNMFDEGDRDAFPLERLSPAELALAKLWFAVWEWDERLNNGVGDEGPQAPTGDDYNELFSEVKHAAGLLFGADPLS